jgi:hypothetical protein
MAEYDNSADVGPVKVAPTTNQQDIISRYDKALGNTGDRARFAANPPSSYSVALSRETVPSGGTAVTTPYVLPWPAKLVAVDVGAAVHGGSLTALTADVLVEPEAGGGYATVLDAPEDIDTPGAGVMTRVAPEDGSEELAFGDKVHASFAATTDTASGACAILHFRRL